jgi:hypothetical protein
MALSARAHADDKCIPERAFCPDPTGADDASRARTLAWVSTGTLLGAAAATVVALLLPKTRVPVSVAIAPSREGAALGLAIALP